VTVIDWMALATDRTVTVTDRTATATRPPRANTWVQRP